MEKCYLLFSSNSTSLLVKRIIQWVYCNHGNLKFNFSNPKKLNFFFWFKTVKFRNYVNSQFQKFTFLEFVRSSFLYQPFSLWLSAPKLPSLIFHLVINLIRVGKNPYREAFGTTACRAKGRKPAVQFYNLVWLNSLSTPNLSIHFT